MRTKSKDTLMLWITNHLGEEPCCLPCAWGLHAILSHKYLRKLVRKEMCFLMFIWWRDSRCFSLVIILRPRRNDQHFFIWHFHSHFSRVEMLEFRWTFTECIHRYSVGDKPALVRAIARRHMGDNTLSYQWYYISRMYISIMQPRWVKYNNLMHMVDVR